MRAPRGAQTDRKTGVKWAVCSRGWPSALSSPTQLCAVWLCSGSSSVVQYTHAHTQSHMSTQIDLQCFSQSQQQEKQRYRGCLWASTFFRTPHRHAQNNCCRLLLLPLTVITCALRSECVCVCGSAHVHKLNRNTDMHRLTADAYRVLHFGFLVCCFF